MTDIIGGSIPVRDLSPRILASHYAALDWATPRYYQSPTKLAGGGAQYRAAFVEDCLVILKWKAFYSQRVAYAILPPMSPTGDHRAERRAVDVLRRNGSGVLLVPDDALRLDILLDALGLIPGNTEYLYQAGDLAGLVGHQWRHVRQYRARAQRARARYSVSPAGDDTGDLEALTRRWIDQKGKGKGQIAQVRSLGRWAGSIVLRLYVGDDLAGFSVVEDVTSGAVTPLRLRDYSVTGIHDPMQLLAHYEAVAEMVRHGDRMINLGAADPVGGTGLSAHKSALHPARRVQVYRLSPTGPLTLPSQPQQLSMVMA